MPHPVPTTFEEALAAVDPAFMAPFFDVPDADLDPVLALRMARETGSAKTEVRAGVRAERRAVPGHPQLTAMVYEPDGRERPGGALLWLFGGGLIIGSAEHSNDIASAFAVDLGALVVVPDYRLAPEHPCPAAPDDCFAALQWMLTHADELGIDPERIVVGGESAGGGLAATVAQRAHDTGVGLRLQVLVAPMLDDRTVVRAEAEGRVSVAWTVPANRFAWTSYLGHAPGEPEERPYAVPGRRADLGGLAPAWISVGEIDLFHQESVDYARRLDEAGVKCELTTVPGAHHAFELVAPEHPVVRALRRARLEAMREALRPRD
ncbi:alpha/beta hydrolase [Streptomyces sp. NPDC058457]|uniref:alpha/beta hydrolase n=1 Tax=Streptomyces sp. NPDC058457 TaxID=3346507 RepID=UPI003653493C